MLSFPNKLSNNNMLEYEIQITYPHFKSHKQESFLKIVAVKHSPNNTSFNQQKEQPMIFTRPGPESQRSQKSFANRFQFEGPISSALHLRPLACYSSKYTEDSTLTCKWKRVQFPQTW